jgi:phosphoglycolate phosphatase-like HAD superfamily hydrolase
MARHGEASNDRMASAVQRVQALFAKVTTSSAAEAKEVREIEEQLKQAGAGLGKGW